MIPNQLQLYRVIESPSVTYDEIAELLNNQRSAPLNDCESRRLGWTAPAGKLNDLLLHEIQGHRLITARLQERKLPKGVINEDLEEVVSHFESEHGRPPSKKEKAALKEQVVESLLPRAFSRSYYFNLWWDTRKSMIGIDASTKAKAEDVLSLLRETLGSLKVIPLNTNTLPHKQFTDWLTDPGTRPPWLTLGGKAKFISKGDGTTFNANNADMDGSEVQTMMENGYQCEHVAVVVENLASCVITDNLALKEIKLKEAVIEECDATGADDPLARFQSDFVIGAGALQSLIEQVSASLGGLTPYKKKDTDSVTADNADAAA